MIISDFNIATDLQVELFLPTAGIDYFTLGISELGGTDVLGGSGPFILGLSVLGGNDVLSGDEPTGYEWTSIECETASVVSTIGGSVFNNLYFQPSAASANITVQSWTYDPTNNPYVRAGTRVRVKLNDSTVQNVIYSGFITGINVSYLPDGPNRINITAVDSYQRLVNSRISVFDTTDPIEFPLGYATPLEIIAKVCNDTGFELSDKSQATLGKVAGELVEASTAAQFISDAIQIGLGLIWIDPADGKVVFKPRPVMSAIPGDTYTIGNNHPIPPATDPYHLCMSDIQVMVDQSEVFNNLKVSLKSDETVYVIAENTDISDLYGVYSQDIVLNTTDIDEITSWADRVFSAAPTKLVKEVKTPAIDRLGDLTEAALIEPGQIIGVKYQTDSIAIDEYYTVIQVQHSIDVNNWITTLKLWKEV